MVTKYIIYDARGEVEGAVLDTSDDFVEAMRISSKNEDSTIFEYEVVGKELLNGKQIW